MSEGYYLLNLKMLVGYKYLSCFCGHADFIIKADDDNYIRMNLLDRVITQKQLEMDRKLRAPKAEGSLSQIQVSQFNQKHRFFIGT